MGGTETSRKDVFQSLFALFEEQGVQSQHPFPPSSGAIIFFFAFLSTCASRTQRYSPVSETFVLQGDAKVDERYFRIEDNRSSLDHQLAAADESEYRVCFPH